MDRQIARRGQVGSTAAPYFSMHRAGHLLAERGLSGSANYETAAGARRPQTAVRVHSQLVTMRHRGGGLGLVTLRTCSSRSRAVSTLNARRTRPRSCTSWRRVKAQVTSGKLSLMESLSYVARLAAARARAAAACAKADIGASSCGARCVCVCVCARARARARVGKQLVLCARVFS